jgi:hypothetical protein
MFVAKNSTKPLTRLSFCFHHWLTATHCLKLLFKNSVGSFRPPFLHYPFILITCHATHSAVFEANWFIRFILVSKVDLAVAILQVHQSAHSSLYSLALAACSTTLVEAPCLPLVRIVLNSNLVRYDASQQARLFLARVSKFDLQHPLSILLKHPISIIDVIFHVFTFLNDAIA